MNLLVSSDDWLDPVTCESGHIINALKYMLESSSVYVSTNTVVYSCRYCVVAEFDPFVFKILSTDKYT